MTEFTKAPLSGVREQQVEKALREIVAPLDRSLQYLFAAFGLLAVLGVPGGVYLLWQTSDGNWFAALFWGGAGVFLLLCVLILPCENLLVGRTIRAFDHRFPEGCPERTPAMDMLAQMESRHKGALKLQGGLNQVVRWKPADPDAQLASALDVLTGPMASLPPVAPSPAVAEQAPPVLRSGGSYDYIPLEPRTPAEEEK